MYCFRAGMNVLYAPIKLLARPRDRVVFLSRQRSEPSADFLLLADEIKRQSPSTDIVWSCRLGKQSDMGLSYVALMLHQMRLLAGARACVTESYCPPISLLRHRRSLRVVQIWHSAVAIKKFGWQTVGLPEGSDPDTARIMRMHAGYDWVCVGSEYQRQFFAEAMRQPLERILPLGTAGADRLPDYDRQAALERLHQKYPRTKDRLVCVWSPTWRRGEAIDCSALAALIDSGRVALIIRPHPLDDMTELFDSRAIIDRETPTLELMAAADAVISDYSGAAAEAALLGRQVFFYVPDLEHYAGQCGVNIDPTRVFPGLSFTTPEDMAAAINAIADGRPADAAAQSRVRELLAGGCDGHSAESIARLVLRGEE